MSCFRFRDLEGEVLELDDNFGDGPLLCVGPGYDPGMRVVQLTPTACRDLAAALLDAAGKTEQPAPSEKSQDGWRRAFLEAIRAGLGPVDAGMASNLYVRGPGKVEELVKDYVDVANVNVQLKSGSTPRMDVHSRLTSDGSLDNLSFLASTRGGSFDLDSEMALLRLLRARAEFRRNA